MNFQEIKAISKNKLQQLDLMVLLGLLYRVGLTADEIVFESRLSLSQSTKLIEEVIFEQNGVRLVVNMGILSANSALPNHILDFFSTNSDSVSFNVLNALASKLLKVQINMLLTERSSDLKDLYLNGDILFTSNDNFFYSLSSLNGLFERALARYKLNVRSMRKLDLIDKSSFLESSTSFRSLHIGNKLLSPKLHFEITLQSETLISELDHINITELIDRLVAGKLFDANREFVAVTVWLIVHPIAMVFIPFLFKEIKLVNNKIKIYERYKYE